MQTGEIVENESGEVFLITEDPLIINFFAEVDYDLLRWYVTADNKAVITVIDNHIELGYN